MKEPTNVIASNLTGATTVRIAAAGDIHVDEAGRDAVATAFEAMDRDADVILLAGDLTTHGEPEQAEILTEACRGVETAIVAVLGNHDLHANRGEEVVAVLEGGGIEVLDRTHTTVVVGRCHVGIAGVKGFVGGFRNLGLPDFGEPSLRAVHAETGDEVAALDAGLREVSACPFRIALMHYAPVFETLHGEPPEIWAFLGSDRLAAPLLEHRPDLVVHGHAHAGRLKGSLQGVPVYNVSIPVMGQDYWLFELSAD